MRLVDYITHETGVDHSHVILVRHFNSIDRLVQLGGTVEEFTAIQPTGTKWDFWIADKPQIDLVVVIVRDSVRVVYRIIGIDAEGTIGSLANEPLRAFHREIDREKLDRTARRFRLAEFPSGALGVQIKGWEGREISPVLRANGELFWAIEADLPEGGMFAEEVIEAAKLREGAVCRVTVNAYERNLEARRRCISAHKPECHACGFDFGAAYGPEFAGFIHVHHLRPLSEIGGEYVVDPVADLRPVCPNCHAVIHHGGRLRSIEEVTKLLASAGRS